jgi:hypothetical protein
MPERTFPTVVVSVGCPLHNGKRSRPLGKEAPEMDKLAELSHGAKVVLGAAIALLVVSFPDWFQTSVSNIGFANMWNGIGVLAGLLLIVLIVWQALRLVNINVEIGVTPSMITAALAVLLFIFVLIRWLDKPGPGEGVDRTFWAWLGVALAIVILVGAWMNMKAAGETFGDVRDRVSAMTAGSGSDAPQPPAATPPSPAATDRAAEAESAASGEASPATGQAADDVVSDEPPRPV